MALKTAQLTTLKAAILAETNPAFVQARNLGQTPLMTEFYNELASPAVKAWASVVDPQTTDEATPWVNFDSITLAGKRDSWIHAFMRYSRDYSKASIRKWITDVWGNATSGSNAEAILLGAGVRSITRGEVVLGGSATTTTGAVTAIKLTWEGTISDTDIGSALSL